MLVGFVFMNTDYSLNIYKIFPSRYDQDFHTIANPQQSRNTSECIEIENQSQRTNNIVIFREDRHWLCLTHKQWCMLTLIAISLGFVLGFVIMSNESKKKNLNL